MTFEVTIHKKNDVYAFIECDRSIAEELNDFFSFFVDGYRFMPAYKNKSWSGKIHLFKTHNQTIYIGLVSYVAEFARSRDYTCSIDDDVLPIDERVTTELTNKYIDILDLHSKGKKISPYVYQRETVEHALREKRCIIQSPTGSGKSADIYMICRFLQQMSSRKILILVPTTGLVYQMYTDFEDYSSEDDWDVEKNCHQIMGGREKRSEKQIYVSTWQSLFRMPANYFKQFGALISDEVHLSKAASIQAINDKLVDCPYKIGLTGTLDGAKTNELTLIGMFGKVYHAITTRKLMDNKQVANLKIQALMLDYTKEEKKNMLKVKYQDEMKWLYVHNRRNDFISHLASIQKKNCLLLFNHRSHGQTLFEKIKMLVGDSRKVYFVDGNVAAEDRDDIRKNLEVEKDSILVASLGTTSTGWSVKNVHSVFFCSPTKSKIRTLQSIGRGLRVSAEKTDVTLFDLCDDLSWRSHQNYAMKHFVERANYYNDERFDYSMTRIAI